VVVAAHCRPHTAVVVHRQALPADDVVRVGGVAVTTPLRTAVDLLCFAEEDTAVAATRVLLRHGLVPELLGEVLSRPVRRLPTRRALRLLGRVAPDRCRARHRAGPGLGRSWTAGAGPGRAAGPSGPPR